MSIATAAPPLTPQVHADQPEPTMPYPALVADAAHRFGIPEAWIDAVIRVESGGNPHAVSSSGAMGLMQLMPQTWREIRAALSLGDDPFDPHDNIMAGTAYLRAMHDRYGMPGALAAYNAGPGRWEAFQAGVQPLPDETIAYVAALASIIDAHALPSGFLNTLQPGPEVGNVFAAPIFVRVGTLGSTDTKQPDPHDDGHLTAENAELVVRPHDMFVAVSTQPGSATNHRQATALMPFGEHAEGLFPLVGRQPRVD